MTRGFARGADATLDALEPERGGSNLVHDLRTREKGREKGRVVW